MHEVGIAQTMLKQAQSALPAGEGAQVSVLRVRLGALAGLSKAELEFGFEIAAVGTPFAGARLEIEELPALIHCAQCQLDIPVDALALPQCPHCGAFADHFIQGKEVQLVSFDVVAEREGEAS